MTMRMIGMISLWMGLLVLPFTGLRKAVLIGGAILAGILIWKGVRFLSEQARIRLFLKGIIQPIKGTSDLGRRPWVKYLGLGIAIFIPPFLNNYAVDVLTLAGLYAVLALGLNIVVGLAGLLDLGYIAFYAIGAYTYALLSVHYGVSYWIGMPLGGLVAALFGMLLGLVTLRLRGDYLAIVTLGFIQIIHLVLNNWDGLTNGPNGILNIGRPLIGGFELDQPIHFYYLILAITLLAFIVVHRLNQSRIGRAWIAIREDEVAAAAMGIHTTFYKVLAFTLGAAWAGIAGSFFAAKFAFISPESFTFLESVFVLAMVVLGGMGSIPGAILGASLLVILPEFLRGLADYRMLFFGALLVLMMVFRPQGLLPSPRRKIELGM